jgi:hypothetical protein
MQARKYLVVKRRYQQARRAGNGADTEEREDVRGRRQFSRSPQGKRNKAKYESTDKGKRPEPKQSRNTARTGATGNKGGISSTDKNTPTRIAVRSGPTRSINSPKDESEETSSCQAQKGFRTDH